MRTANCCDKHRVNCENLGWREGSETVQSGPSLQGQAGLLVCLWVNSRAAMAVLPAEGDVLGLSTIQDVVRLLRVPPTLWDAFTEQVGNPGQDLRVLAASPAHIIVHGIG